tara:strand:+ start:31 stop:228 length:198 start_codon:yes stop_codon:yes gene_type:complete
LIEKELLLLEIIINKEAMNTRLILFRHPSCLQKLISQSWGMPEAQYCINNKDYSPEGCIALKTND